eukprot:Selendium_serpulae@DN6513_c3_g2_i1.p1
MLHIATTANQKVHPFPLYLRFVVQKLERTGLTAPEILLKGRVLEWVGHVRRMDSSRLPNQLMCGRPVGGKRIQGGQKLGYLEVVNRMAPKISGQQVWWTACLDRDKWNNLVFGNKTRRRRRSPKRRPDTTEDDEREEQPKEDETARDRTCPLCRKVYRSPQGLSLHLRSCRLKEQKKQAALELSANDGNETETILAQPTQSGWCVCQECGKKFRNNKALTAHKLVHRKKPP